MRHVFMQEIQEALDERQNNLDSLLAHDHDDLPAAEPFAFESQIDTDTYPVDLSSRSIDESLQRAKELEANVSNETIPLLPVPNQRQQSEAPPSHRRKTPSWISAKDSAQIKRELVTPVRPITSPLTHPSEVVA